MKNSNFLKMATMNAIKGFANLELKHNSNSTTCGAIFQPKAPIALKKFSKVKNDK